MPVTVIDECVKMVGNTCWLLLVSVTMILEEPVSLYTGASFCHNIYFLVSLGVAHGFTGGLGIAVMRIIFIIFQDRVPFRKREIALLISLTSLAASAGIAHTWVTAPKLAPDLPSFCLGRSADLHTTLFYYSSKHSWTCMNRAKGLLATGVLLVTAELGIYISIYHFLIKHDIMMRMVLSENAVQKRIKRNVVSLAGHSVGFALETAFLVLGMLPVHLVPPSHWWLLRLPFLSLYGLLSALHLAMSRALREECTAMWNYLYVKYFFQHS